MSDRVTFDSGSAARIAKVVRIVEAGNRDSAGLPTAPRFGSLPKDAIRFATWSASWDYSSQVQIEFSPPTGVTAQATNLVLGVGAGQGWVARRGTQNWHLVMFDMTQVANYSGSDIQLFGHSDSGVAVWYDITTCTASASV